jgi:hypothetical protein
LFIYLQNDLKSHQIFGDYNFWENYTLLAVRNSLRLGRFDNEESESKPEIMKEIAFQKLAEIIDTMLGFDLPKDIVKTLITCF